MIKRAVHHPLVISRVPTFNVTSPGQVSAPGGFLAERNSPWKVELQFPSTVSPRHQPEDQNVLFLIQRKEIKSIEAAKIGQMVQ